MSERSPGGQSGVLVLGLVCSLAAALPALARVWQLGNEVLAALGLWAASSLVVVPVAAWLRKARAGGLGGSDQALLAGTALSALPLALFGGVLKSTTHHRPLGGATFAVAALCVLALCVGLSFRFLGGLSRDAAKSLWQNLFTLGCGLSLACALLLGVGRGARPSLVDFLALAAAVGAASVIKIPSWLQRLSVAVAVAGWLALLGGAVVALRDPQLVRSLTTLAPVSFAPLSWLGVGS